MEMGFLINKSLVDLVAVLNFKRQSEHGYGNRQLGQHNNHLIHEKVIFDSTHWSSDPQYKNIRATH